MNTTFLNADNSSNAHLCYVIKKHRATSLHYDLRFMYRSPLGELELASFVIPKGPSLDPTCKRLAIRVEDHKLRNMDFEGVYPLSLPGAGPVLVWDRGFYRALSGITGQRVELETALREGLVVLELDGKKLNGRFELRLVRKHHREEWILLKLQDHHVVAGSNIVDAQPNSVLSNRSLEEIADGVSVRKKRDDMTGRLFDSGD